MPSDQTVDFVVMFLTIGLVVLGLLSLLVGWLVRTWDRIMSRYAPVPTSQTDDAEHRSYAAEPPTEPSATEAAELVPYLAEQLSDLDDDELLEVLALLKSPDGYRFAESRIAKFIPGRDEDRISQVRAVRGVEPEPAPAGRVLKVRDSAGERLIPY
jgi:hypothetical protein